MEELTRRERIVLAEIASFARQHGRWGTTREIGSRIAKREGKPSLSVNSTVRNLFLKGYISRDGKSYAIKGFTVKVRRAVLVKKG